MLCIIDEMQFSSFTAYKLHLAVLLHYIKPVYWLHNGVTSCIDKLTSCGGGGLRLPWLCFCFRERERVYVRWRERCVLYSSRKSRMGYAYWCSPKYTLPLRSSACQNWLSYLLPVFPSIWKTSLISLLLEEEEERGVFLIFIYWFE